MTRFISTIFADLTREDIKDLLFVLSIGSIASAAIWGMNIHAGLALHAFSFIALTTSPIGLILTLALLLIKDGKWNALITLIDVCFGTLAILFSSKIALFITIIVGAMIKHVVSDYEDKQ